MDGDGYHANIADVIGVAKCKLCNVLDRSRLVAFRRKEHRLRGGAGNSKREWGEKLDRLTYSNALKVDGKRRAICDRQRADLECAPSDGTEGERLVEASFGRK